MTELKGCPNPACRAESKYIKLERYSFLLNIDNIFLCICIKCGAQSSEKTSKETAKSSWNNRRVYIPEKEIICGGCGESDYSFFRCEHSLRFMIDCHKCPNSVSIFNSTRADLIWIKGVLITDFEKSTIASYHKIDIEQLIKEEQGNGCN